MQTVYVACPDSKQIYTWRLDSAKVKLELMQIVHTVGNAQPITIHPNQQFLYTGIRPNFCIVTYSIDREGLLNKIKTTQIPSSLTYLTINKSGTFLYCVSYNFNAINVISINTIGIPDNIVQTIENLLGCHSAKFDRNQHVLWVPCLLEHSIRIFNVHVSQGILNPYIPDRIIIKNNAGPRHITFNNFDNYIYVINEFNGTINVIKYNFKKNITPPIIIQTISILPNNIEHFWSSDIHITPDNHWLYCTDRLLSIISCFRILPESKKLKFIHYQHTEKQPRGFAIDKTGQFLIVAGQKSNYIALYHINLGNGKLNLISRYISGMGPMWVSILSSNI